MVAEDKGGVLTSAAVVAGDRLVLSFERDAYVQVSDPDILWKEATVRTIFIGGFWGGGLALFHVATGLSVQ